MVTRTCIDAMENYPAQWWWLCREAYVVRRIRFRVAPGEAQWWADRMCFTVNEI